MDEHGIYIPNPKKSTEKSLSLALNEIFMTVTFQFMNSKIWKRDPWLVEEVLKEQFVNYPDLSFEQFMTLILNNNPMELLPEVNKKLTVGPMTAQFILFYFKKPF